MPSRPLTNNQIAAVLAFFAGLVFIAVEWNGTRIEAEFVILLAEYLPGSNPGLVLLARVLALISPLSAAFVIAGRGRKLSLEKVDGEPVVGSAWEPVLVELGFRQGPRKLTLSA